MPGRGRSKKIPGKTYPLYLSLSKDELSGLLKLIAKRFDETDQRITEQDLIREALRDMLLREGIVPTTSLAPGQHTAPRPNKRVQ